MPRSMDSDRLVHPLIAFNVEMPECAIQRLVASDDRKKTIKCLLGCAVDPNQKVNDFGTILQISILWTKGTDGK